MHSTYAIDDAAGDDDRTRERERAIQLGYRAVGYRDRTVAEPRTFLERKRVEPEAIADAVAELTAAGCLDDARFARRFAEDKRGLDVWGAERIARDLHRRGIAPDLIERGGRPQPGGRARDCRPAARAAPAGTPRRPRSRPRLAPPDPPRV